MDLISEALIIRIKDGQAAESVDLVAAETAFTLYVNGELLVSLLCSPAELDAMAIGFLLSEGMLRDRESLLSVAVDEAGSAVAVKLKDLPAGWQQLMHKRTITSGCGQGVTFTDPRDLKSLPPRRHLVRTSPPAIRRLLQEFRTLSDLYVKTGGAHSAALADDKKILLFAEDIGRHNAVDKLLGKAFLAGIALDDKILLSSGRISGEIMTKVVRNRIPVLVSRAAPTCMSVTFAEEHGVTLIGFARGGRMNIYTHPAGVIFEKI